MAKKSHENLNTKIDDSRIVFDTAKAEEVILRILDLPLEIFITYPAKVTFKKYQTRWQIGDIYISRNAERA